MTCYAASVQLETSRFISLIGCSVAMDTASGIMDVTLQKTITYTRCHRRLYRPTVVLTAHPAE